MSGSTFEGSGTAPLNADEYDLKGKRIKLGIWYPELPPSTNKLYYLGTRLTTPARNYREHFRQHVQQTYGHFISEMEEPNYKAMVQVKQGKKFVEELKDVSTKNPNLVYGLSMTFYMDCLTSWSDLSKSPSKRASFRFKHEDVTNRIKFVEDCFKYALDIDDSLTFCSSQMKVHSPHTQGVHIYYYVMSPEQFGIPLWKEEVK